MCVHELLFIYMCVYIKDAFTGLYIYAYHIDALHLYHVLSLGQRTGTIVFFDAMSQQEM